MLWNDMIWCWYYDINVVQFDWCYLTISYLSIYVSIWLMILFFHERSYNENYTPSRPLWEVKSHLAWSVVRWVTTCEARVLFVLFFIPIHSCFFVHHSFLFIFVSFILSHSHSIKRDPFLFKLSVFFLSPHPHTIIALFSLGIFSGKTETLASCWSVGQQIVRSIRRERIWLRGEMKSIKIWAKDTYINTINNIFEDLMIIGHGVHKQDQWFPSLSHSQLLFLTSLQFITRTLHTTIWPENFKKHKLTIHEGKVLIKWIPRWLAYTQFNQPSRSFLWFYSIISKIYPWILNRMIILC